MQASSVIVEAFDVAAGFNLIKLRSMIGHRGSTLGRNPLILFFQEDRYIAIFDYGTIVFFNFPKDELRAWLGELKEYSSGINRQEFTDNFVLIIGGEQEKAATTEQVWVKKLTLDVVKLVAIILSRSVALEYYEILIEQKMDNLIKPVRQLTEKGKLGFNSRKFIKKVGSVLSINLELVHSLHLLDEPDITWESTEMQGLYRQLNDLFDLTDRSQAIERKLEFVKESCQVILGLQHSRSSLITELAIIALFIIDIILLFTPFKP